LIPAKDGIFDRHTEYDEITGFLFPDRVGHRSCRDDDKIEDLNFYEIIFLAHFKAIDVPIL
jgi:hypothetical protein